MTSLLGTLFLAGCGAPVALTAMEGGAMYATKPADLPPADRADQIAPHESWCYRTLGTIDCYVEPQDTPASRLVMVDPANRYPLTARAYRADLHPVSQQTAVPVVSPPVAEAVAMPDVVQATPLATVPPKATVHRTKHKAHKKPKSGKKRVACPPKDATPSK